MIQIDENIKCLNSLIKSVEHIEKNKNIEPSDAKTLALDLITNKLINEYIKRCFPSKEVVYGVVPTNRDGINR